MKAVWDALPKNIPEEEMMELFRQMAAGNTEARAKIIEVNMRLSVSVARNFLNLGVPLEDLIGIANVGLVKAVDTFKPEKGHKFATYAGLCMRNQILMQERSEKRFRGAARLDAVSVESDHGEPLTFADFMGEEDERLQEFIDLEGLRQVLDVAAKRAEGKTAKLQLECVKLVGIEGKSQIEASEIIGTSRSYVSRLYIRGIERLKRIGIELGIFDVAPQKKAPMDKNANKVNIIKQEELDTMRGRPAQLDHGITRWLMECTALKMTQIAEILETSVQNLYNFKKRLSDGAIPEPPNADAEALYKSYVERLPSFEKSRLMDREHRRKQEAHEAPSKLITYKLPKEENKPAPEPAPEPVVEIAATVEPEFTLELPDAPEVGNTPTMNISLESATVDNIADFMELFMLQLSKDKKYTFQVSVSSV